jgi:hypothetical protein
MNILHITPHLGGGVGTVIMDWIEKDNPEECDKHNIMCLDYLNPKAADWAHRNNVLVNGMEIGDYDIVLVH